MLFSSSSSSEEIDGRYIFTFRVGLSHNEFKLIRTRDRRTTSLDLNSSNSGFSLCESSLEDRRRLLCVCDDVEDADDLLFSFLSFLLPDDCVVGKCGALTTPYLCMVCFVVSM